MNVTLPEIQANLSELLRKKKIDRNIIFDILKIYTISTHTVSRLKSGTSNKSKNPGEFLQKDLIYIKFAEENQNIFELISNLEKQENTKTLRPKFLVVLNDSNLAAINLRDSDKTTRSLHCNIEDLANNAEFFFELTGRKIDRSTREESEADRRAAEKMNKLYEEIEKVNIEKITSGGVKISHDLNVFFSRLLFCLFAEDTNIFEDRQFSKAIELYTEKNGAGMCDFFKNLFLALDTDNRTGLSLTKPYIDFPYVNGSIFNVDKHDIFVPEFSADARSILLELTRSDWGKINPDIFGTIFQGVVDPTKRDERGMDYTSVPNIMKVIRPLFLDELEQEFDKIIESDILPKTKVERLQKLWSRISKIKIFDPACGSGNFLIITYKKLRELESNIIESLNENMTAGIGAKFTSQIKLENFYGIEIDDFAHELAVLSLYIAAHQMNIEFEKRFGKKISIIPLQDNPKIVCANAARIDWQEVCPNLPHKLKNNTAQSTMFDFSEPAQETPPTEIEEWDEIYLIGNPPYKGSKKQSREQKSDLENYFKNEKYSKNLDYIALWFIKGARYISGSKAKLAFVSTNSVAQGEHVSAMFPKIFDEGVEIGFAYTSFRWKNNAKDNAGVTVVIINLQSPQEKYIKTGASDQKIIFTENQPVQKVDNINGYLSGSKSNTVIKKQSSSICNLPKCVFGSQPIDGGYLIMSEEETSELLSKYPNVKEIIRKYSGGDEYINGKNRYCLWIENYKLDFAVKIPKISERIKNVANFRLSSGTKSTQKLAEIPHRFASKKHIDTISLIIPATSSENRDYIPMGFLNKNTIISNAAFAIYDAPLWLFALLESKMHMAWIRTVCGKLKTDYRYSSTLGYNTFPVPPLSQNIKQALEYSAKEILFARENHTEKTLAQMYDPDKMPADLRKAHIANDLLVDKIYSDIGFENDEQRLTKLFELYEQMTRKDKK